MQEAAGFYGGIQNDLSEIFERGVGIRGVKFI
jgi:hypothetical protein